MKAVRRLGESLFVAEAPGHDTRRGLLLGLVGVGVLAFVAGLRASATPITTTMWAEDGRIFLGDALGRGAWRSLLLGYNGYSHLVPRALAAVVALAPAQSAAFVNAVLACAVTGCLAVFCARAARAHIRRPVARAIYASLIVLLPVAAVESLGNLANLHWFLLVAAFWASLWRPRTRHNVVLACVIVAAAVLSDPLALVLAPLLLWRVVTVTDWRERAVAITFALAAVVELAVVANTPGVGTDPAMHATLRLFEQRVGVGSVLGVEWTTSFVDRFGAAGVHLAFAALVVVGAVLWWRYGRSARLFVAVSVATTVVLFIVAVALRGGGAVEQFISGAVTGGSRYTVAPALIAVGATIAILERGPRLVAAAAFCVTAFVCFADFRVPTLRTGELTWARGVASARQACRAGAEPAKIPILPETERGEWFVPVPCSYVNP